MHLVPFKYFRRLHGDKKMRLFVFNVTKTFPWFSTAPRGTAFPQNFVEYPPENIHFSEGFLSFVIKARSFGCGWCILFFSAEIAETEALHERKQPLPQTYYPWWVVIAKIMTTSKFACVPDVSYFLCRRQHPNPCCFNKDKRCWSESRLFLGEPHHDSTNSSSTKVNQNFANRYFFADVTCNV